MSLLRLAAALAVMGAVALTASTSEACPNGVIGIADPGSTVCAEDLATSVLYCDVADAAGNFNIIGGVVPPSTSFSCLPTSGQFNFYEIGCEKEAIVVDRDDDAQQYGGPWLDLRCDDDGHGCGGGKCDHGSYIDGCTSYSPSSPISQAMCGGSPIDPTTCTGPACKPYKIGPHAGVCDSFATTNGVEASGASAGLLGYIASVYSVVGSRDFDDIHSDQWFGHTFTGLAPKNGAHICGAKLVSTIGHGIWSANDSLALMFVDSSGTSVAPGYVASLTTWGILNGTSATVSLDIGSLPGGAAMLTQMENGWLDFIVQDDTAVDCVGLVVSYCCDGQPTGGDADPPPTSK
jgi:hypothetical protein